MAIAEGRVRLLQVGLSSCLLCTLLLLSPSASGAAEQLSSPSPLPLRQMNPAMLRYLDPLPESAWPARAPGWQFSLHQHYSTLFLADTLPTANRYIADMELYVVDIEWRRRMTGAREFSVDLPVLRPAAGSFDSVLRNYHNTLGLPNGGRELRPDNRFAYDYAPGRWQGRARWETGNMQIKFRQGLIARGDSAVALLGSMQLPTANRARGWGHGGIDAGLGIAADAQIEAWFAHIEAWQIHPFKRNDSGMRNRDYTRATAMLGLNAPLFSLPLQWLVQVQGGSSPYGTGTAELDQQAWIVSFAMRWQDKGQAWTFGFVEGITQRTSQDFGLLLSTTLELPD